MWTGSAGTVCERTSDDKGGGAKVNELNKNCVALEPAPVVNNPEIGKKSIQLIGWIG